jgi:uncharacterized protein
MQVNVAQLLKESIGSTRSYDVDEPIDLDITGDEGGGVVTGKVTLTHTNRGILATGTFETEIQIDCSRCLCRFRCPLRFEIQDEYFPLVDIFTGVPLPAPEEPDAFTIDEQHILDLTEALRQGILLSLPMKPLCREDCAGLCPQCGQNLNEAACGCKTESVDPRWAKLAGVKAQLKKTGR